MAGLDVTTTLASSPTSVRFRTASLFGEEEIAMAASAVSSTSSGYAKPIGSLIFAMICGVLAIWSLFTGSLVAGSGAGLVGGVVFVFLALYSLVRYVLDKRIRLSVETNGGRLFGLAFKRSVLEGVPVDIDRARAAMALLNRNVLESQRR